MLKAKILYSSSAVNIHELDLVADMNLSRIIVVISVTCLLVLATIIHVYTQLPQDLVDKLHRQLRVAYYSGDPGYADIIERYYQFAVIGGNQLYDLSPYDVLILTNSREYTTEQINSIVKFVDGGGGLIIFDTGYCTESGSLLLSKLGIVSVYRDQNYISQSGIVYKDGKALLDHPITVDVEAVKFYVYAYRSVPVRVNVTVSTSVIMKWPFLILAMEYGNGRIVFLGYELYWDTLSGPRLAVNMIEWVAGFTPPGWEPPTYNKTFITVTQTVTVTETESFISSITIEKTSTATLREKTTLYTPTTVTTRETLTTTRLETISIPVTTVLMLVTPSPITLITTSVVTSRETTTATAIEWTTTSIVAVVLLIIGFAIGYMIRRR